MAQTKTMMRSFGGGEVSPQLFGRIDDTKYQTGLETCLNGIVLPQGSVENRAGFAFVREVKDSSKKVRLLRFTFNNTQTMVLEVGDKYIRFHTNGQTVMNADGSAPYEIAAPWAAEDLDRLNYVQSGDVLTVVHPSYPPQEIRRYTATDWRVAPVVFNTQLKAPANVKAERASAAAEDKNENKYSFQYKVSALNADKTEESAPSGEATVVANLYAYGTTVKVSWDAVPGAVWYRVYKCQAGLYGYIGDTQSLSIIDDNIAPDKSITPRLLDSPFVVGGGITSVEVVKGGTNYVTSAGGITGYKLPGKYELNAPAVGNWREEHDLTSFPIQYRNIIDGTDYGANIAEVVSVRVTEDGTQGSGAKLQCIFDRVAVSSFSGYTNYSDRLTDIKVIESGQGYINPVIHFSCHQQGARGQLYGIDGTIPAAYVSGDITLTVIDQAAKGSGAQLKAEVDSKTGAITAVRVLSGGRNYANPKIEISNIQSGSGAEFKINFGQSGNYPAAVGYFEQRRVFGGMPQDPQRIIMTRSGTESDLSYSLPYQDDDEINKQVVSPETNQILHFIPLNQLLVLSSGAEMRVSPANSDSLSPTAFRATPQSTNGTTYVMPLVINNNVVYCAGRGGHLLEFAYSYDAGGYLSGDLCLRASHLFDFKTIKDMTYQKAPYPIVWCVSSDGSLLGLTYIAREGVGAWHHHTTQGAFESCACVSEGDEDFLYVVVRRVINGRIVRYIERMASRKFESQEDCFFVDCGGTYSGPATKEISGLDWLEGQTVSILADGAVMPQKIVKDGKITLEEPASKVQVGLPYNFDLKTLPLIVQDPAYGMGRMKNVPRAHLRVYQSSGILAGPSFDEKDLVEYKQRTTESPGSPAALKTGEIDLALFGAWSDGGSICVRQADPLPVTIQSLALTVET